MGMLVDGIWTDADAKKTDAAGRFVRKPATFRGHIGEEDVYPVEANRYRLIVAWPCPWCHRALIARNIARLQQYVPVVWTASVMGTEGWQVDGQYLPTPLAGDVPLHMYYTASDTRFTGVASVPILWDSVARKIVNNESVDIVGQLLASSPYIQDISETFCLSLGKEAQEISDLVHSRINEGVYRAGFATSQAAYDEAIDDIFGGLTAINRVLSERTYLGGAQLSLADVYAFPTLIRFDPIYSVLMRCNLKRITEYEHLFAYLKRLYRMPEFMETVNIDEYRQGYFNNLKKLNPSGIIPAGPILDYGE